MMKIFAFAMAALLGLATPAAWTANVGTPAIAVAADANTADAPVSAQAGRSAYLLLFDAKGTFLDALPNPYKDSSNAGIPTIDLVASKGATTLVAGGFGGRIVEVMKGKGVRPVEFKGSAKDAVKKALAPG